MFNKTDELFTYIVPSNEAWEDINHQFASAYKILFMGAFAYQVNTIKIIDDSTFYQTIINCSRQRHASNTNFFSQ